MLQIHFKFGYFINKPFEAEFPLNNTSEFSPYFKENAMGHHCKDK